MKVLSLLLTVLLFSSASAFGGNWEKIHSKAWKFPYGKSTSREFLFRPVLQTEKIAITYSGDECELIEVRYIEVAYEPEGRVYRLYPARDNVFNLNSTTLAEIKIFNQQGKYTSLSCTESFFAYRKDTTDPVNGDGKFTYLGSVQTPGGDVTVELPVTTKEVIRSFWVEKPTFCDGITIEKAGTLTEGVLDEAKRVDSDRDVFEINGGSGMRISAIQLEISGPSDLQCPLAVYVKSK